MCASRSQLLLVLFTLLAFASARPIVKINTTLSPLHQRSNGPCLWDGSFASAFSYYMSLCDDSEN
ncbi:hypothetical protein K461DRAFT_282441, partial [Myriangium duriaei CBS 260.36]